MAYRKRKLQDTKTNEFAKKHKDEDEKYKIIDLVQTQKGIRGQLILFHGATDTPYTILNNAVDRIKGALYVTNLNVKDENGNSEFLLRINTEVLARGFYGSETSAKKGLSELVVNNLKKTCFTIFRKIQPRDSSKVNLTSPTSSAPSSCTPTTSQMNLANIGGIGAKMMANMGWSGKGLGSQEQGRTDIVQPFLQIERQGLGTKNIVQEVRGVLENYAASHDINSIAFSPEFTKDERAVIHDISYRLNLISKSYGKADNRLLVVHTKIKPWDLVRSLLDAGGETEQLKLIFPTSFVN